MTGGTARFTRRTFDVHEEDHIIVVLKFGAGARFSLVLGGSLCVGLLLLLLEKLLDADIHYVGECLEKMS